MAQRPWLGWDGAHDSLWAASLAPLLDVHEMAQRVDRLAATVRARPGWRAAYRAAFGALMPADDERLVVDIAKALAADQATLVSPRTPFDAFRDALDRGSLATIEDVVRHGDELDEDRLHADGTNILRPLKLSAGDAADLAAFLRSLGR